MIFDNVLSSLSEGTLRDMLDRQLDAALSMLVRDNGLMAVGHTAMAASCIEELERRGLHD